MTTLEKVKSSISYTETGRGEPVVLIHCSTASGKEWESLCETLAEQFHCIVPDQWSCGRSQPWPGEGPFSLASEAAPIVELIDRAGIPVHLVGHSYGGGVAMRIARDRPRLIRSLTLIEPSAFHLLRSAGPRELVLHEEISRVADAVREAVSSGDLWQGMRQFTDYWNGDGTWDAMPVDARLKLSQRLGKLVLDFKALFEEPASANDYATLDCPTLLVCGDRSPGPSRRIVETLGDAMPNARITRVPNAGHMSPFTHKEFVNETIARHLLETSQSRHRQAA